MKPNYIAGDWTEGPNVSRNINPSDTRDLIGEYAQADAAQTDLATALQFGEIALRTVNGYTVRLRDVARIEQAAASERSSVREAEPTSGAFLRSSARRSGRSPAPQGSTRAS